MASRDFKSAARKIRQMSRNVSGGHADGLRVIGESIMSDVNASRPGHGVPVDEGTLRSTGRVTQPGPDLVLLTWGGSAAPYALVQHERLDFRHTVGEARYAVRGVERFQFGGSTAERAMRANAEAGIRAAAASG